MATKQTNIDAAKEFVQAVKSQGIKLKKAILFGSAARGESHEYSDMDIALVADEFTGVGFIDIPSFIAALRKYYVVQPKTYTTKDFEAGDAFIDEIQRTGIDLPV